jgi:hypothetical protein
MAKLVLVVLVLFSLPLRADLFNFGAEKSAPPRIPALVEKLRGLEMKDGPEFEDLFNQTVKGIENAVEEEKLYCAGEATTASGKSVEPGQKQLCMRQLKKAYLEATAAIFEAKKKYLGFIHQRQLRKLSDVQARLRADIEKNF